MKALITGITGQDGSYLAELLLSKGYEVHGIIRRSSNFNTQRIDHLYRDPHDTGSKLHLHYGDLTDGVLLTNLIREIEPHEIYNLGAQSHVMVSFSVPEYTAQVDAVGTIRMLEAIRSSQLNCKFCRGVRTSWLKQTLFTLRRRCSAKELTCTGLIIFTI